MDSSALRAPHEIESSPSSSNYEWTWPIAPPKESDPDQVYTDLNAHSNQVGAPVPRRSLSLAGELDATWYQGRGVFGGFTAALTLDAMMRLEPTRPPRSLTIFCSAPAYAGPARLEASVERQGRRVSHLSARLYSAESPKLLDGSSNLALSVFAGASFGLTRDFVLSVPKLIPPVVPPPEEVAEVPKDLTMMPAFYNHFSYRFCIGSPPYTGASEPVMGGWCDVRAEGPITYPLIAALLDAWAPAACASISEPTVAASLDFSYHFLVTPEELATLQRPFLYRGEVLHASEGYLEERDCLWDRTGRLVATARQMIAIS